MNIREVCNALNEIKGHMSNPEGLVVAKVENGEVVFTNGVAYSLTTKERVR